MYGSGLLSSYGEIAHAIDSPEVQRYPIQLEWVVNQYFEIDHYQPLLFIVDSFDHLFELVGELEQWMRRGAAGQRLAGRAGDQRARSAELPGGVAGEVTARIAVLDTPGRPVTFTGRIRGRNSVVECQLPKLDVAGSSPVARSLELLPPL